LEKLQLASVCMRAHEGHCLMLGHVRSLCGRKWVQNSGHVRSLCGHKGQNLGACSIQTASGNGWSVVMSDPKFVRFYTIAWLASQQRHRQKIIFTGIWSHFTIISARTLQDLQATPPTLQGIINTLNICEAMADALSVHQGSVHLVFCVFKIQKTL